MNRFIILFFLLVCGCAKARFEYKIETPHDINLPVTLNKLGNEGWELVESRRVITGNEFADKARTELVFKRRK